MAQPWEEYQDKSNNGPWNDYSQSEPQTEKGVASPLEALTSLAGGYLDSYPFTRRVAGALGALGASGINLARNAISDDSVQQPYFNPNEGLTAVDQAIGEAKNLAPDLYYSGLGAGVAGQVASGAGPLSNAISSATQGSRLAQIAALPVAGAIEGGIIGADNSRNMEELPSNIAKNAALGFAIPAAAGIVQGAYRGGKSALSSISSPNISQESAKTALDFNIPLTVDQVKGGNIAPAVARFGSQSALTGGPQRAGYQAANEGLENAILDVTGKGVTRRVADSNEAANTLVSGYNKGVEKVQKSFSNKYDKVYDAVSQDTPIISQNISTVADDIIANTSNPVAKLTGYDDVNQVATALKSPMTLQDARRAKSTLYSESQKLRRAGDNEKANYYDQLRASLSQDIDGTISSIDPEAGLLLERTNRQYSQFKGLEEAADRIVGKAQDGRIEQATSNFINKASGGALDQEAITSLKKLVPNEEWNTFADYAARSLGDVNGEFNPATFAKKISGMNDKTLNAVFNNTGKSNDIRRLVNLTKEIKPVAVNPSGTAANIGIGAAEGLAAVGAGFASPTLLLAPLLNYGLGKTLTNPKLARAYLKAASAAKSGNVNAVVNSLVKNGISRVEAASIFAIPAAIPTVEVTPRKE